MESGSILTTGTTSSATTGATQRLADNFDTFLKLLTTQLQHQNPLEPMDSSEFTQQLVSFAGVEQTIATNRNLEKMVSLLQGNQITASLGYLGKTVAAQGTTAALADGVAQWNFTLGSGVQSASVTVTNADGKVVYNGPAPTVAGTHIFVWDGVDNQGVVQPDGYYDLIVVARDSLGTPLEVKTSIEGVVTGIENVDGKLVLTVNGRKIPLEDVTAIKDVPATAAGSTSTI